MENDLFLFYVVPLCILLFGIIGNVLGLVILVKRKKHLVKIGPLRIYFYLFIIDTVYLTQIIGTIISNIGYDISIINSFSCKINNYFNYSLSAISPMLLVYLSFDRFISIKFPSRSIFMRRRNNQIIFSLVVTIFNIIFYIPVPFYYDLSQLNSTQNDTLCYFSSEKGQLILSLMDLLNRVILPSSLMLISSNLLICLIVNLRARILAHFQAKEILNFNRNVRLAFSSMLLNFLFISLNLPIGIILFLPFSNVSFLITFYMCYLSYSINFYVILATNFVFRNEALALFKLKKTNTINFDFEMDNTHMQQIKL